MSDRFAGQTAPVGSARDYFAITPHDATPFPVWTRAIYVGTAGNVVAVKFDGTAVMFSSVA